MNSIPRRLAISALIAAFAASVPLAAQAQDTPRPIKRHRHVSAGGDIYVRQNHSYYIVPSPAAAVGTEDHYFSDTVVPNYPLGPTIFQRWGTSN